MLDLSDYVWEVQHGCTEELYRRVTKCLSFSVMCWSSLPFKQVNSADKILELLNLGNSRRKTESTEANETSSRSVSCTFSGCS